MLVIPQAVLVSRLEALVDTAGDLEVVHVHLYKEQIGPTKATLLAEFLAAEADFDGYAALGPLVWGEVFFDTNGKATVVSDNQQFHMDGATTPNTIYGMFATNAAGDELKFSEEFLEPVPMVDAESVCIITPVYTIG